MNKKTPNINFEKVKEDLSSLDTDWKTREDHLQILLDNLPRLITNASTFDTFCELAKAIALQFSDLRSMIVKLASAVVQDFTSLTKKNNSPKVFAFTSELLREPSFLKALGSANKVTAQHAQAALESMITRMRLSFDALVEFFNNNSSSKIIAMRERVTEAILGFILSEKKHQEANGDNDSIPNGDSGSKERPNAFEQPTAKSRPQGSAKNCLPITQDNRSNGKNNQQDFYQKAADLFIKDAAANVRGTAKLIKAELICVGQFDFSKSAKDVPRAKPVRFDSRSISRRENVSIDKANPSSRQLKAKPMSAQVIPLDAIVTEKANPKPYRKNPSVLKTKSTRGIVESVSFLIDSALKTLNDKQATIADKVAEVNRVMTQESKYIVIDMEQFLEFMRHLDTTKSSQLHETLSRLLTSVSTRAIREELFNKICHKRWINRPNMAVVVNHVARQMGFSQLVDAFIGYLHDDMVILIDRHFNIEEFDLIVAKSPEVIKSMIQRISECVIENKNSTESLSLLEKLIQVKQAVQYCTDNSLDQRLMDVLERNNQSLFKFLMAKQGRPIMSSKKSMRNDEKANAQSETAKIQELMSRANLVTRKNILKSITGHVAKLGSPDVAASTRTKIATKTIAILDCLSASSDSADEEILLLAFDVLDKLVLVSLEMSLLHNLFEASSRLFDVHQDKFDTEQVERLLEFVAIEPRYLLSVILRAEKADIHSISQLTFIFRQLKTFPNKSEIITKTKSMIDDFLQSIRTLLVCHSNIEIRKMTVGMLVQLYISLGPKRAAEINSTFTPEQQTLINVYMKKALL
jgi:hypothetical protein